MRIAVIAPPWLPVPPVGYGGTEEVVDTLARGLQAAGHEVLLIAHPESQCPVPKASVVPAGDEFPMGRSKIELEHALGAYDLAVDYDVISDHTLAGPIVALCHRGTPVVTTNHNPFDRSRTAILQAASTHVDVVAISRSHAATSTVPIAAVIHHGIDLDRFPVGDGDGGYFVTLTRMAPSKGVDRAARLARQAGIRLLIAAKLVDQNERDYFEQAVKPHLGGGVEYIGEVDATEKRQLLGDATAMLNPIAWEEPFGMAMVESLACGTPVIVTSRGAAPEIVESGVNGLLADTDDEILQALADVAGISRATCRTTVKNRFSAAVMCEQYVNAYQAATEHTGVWVG